MIRTFVFSIALLASLSACNRGFDYGSTGQITGVLKLDGKPLEKGYVVNFMEPKKGYLAFGTTDEQGKFTVHTWNNGDMPIGPYRVSVVTPTDPADELPPDQRFDAAPKPQAKPKSVIPKKYSDLMTSGLEFEVKEGANHFEVNLDSSAKG
jgi:hypothetical protein